MKVLLKLIVISALLLVLVNCSDDDKNPTSPETPASVGTYSGISTNNKPVTLVISAINGEAWLTKYTIEFQENSGGTTASGTASRTDTEGLVKLVNNSFTYSLGSTEEEILMGTVNGSTLTGSFLIKFNSVDIAATFSLSKQ